MRGGGAHQRPCGPPLQQGLHQGQGLQAGGEMLCCPPSQMDTRRRHSSRPCLVAFTACPLWRPMQNGEERCVRLPKDPCAATTCAVGSICVPEARLSEAGTLKLQSCIGFESGFRDSPSRLRCLLRTVQGQGARCVSACAVVRCRSGYHCKTDKVRPSCAAGG